MPTQAAAGPALQSKTAEQDREAQEQETLQRAEAPEILGEAAAAGAPPEEATPPTVQTKVAMGTSGDGFEREADATADRVVQLMESGNIGGHDTARLAAKCTHCREEEEKLRRQLETNHPDEPVQAAAKIPTAPAPTGVLHACVDFGAGTAPPSFQRLAKEPTRDARAAPASVDQALASPGQPLEPALRQDMERHFGDDFSGVRVLTGAAASQSAQDVNAHAYTVGQKIVFGSGKFQPASKAGQALLAHELTHVVQQTGGRSSGLQAQPRSGGQALPDVTGLVRIARETDQALVALILLVESSGADSAPRRVLLADLRQRQVEQRGYADVLEFVAQNPALVSDPARFVSLLWLPSTGSSLDSEDLAAFMGSNQPLRRQIQLRVEYHRRLLTVLNLLQPRVRELSSRLAAAGVDPPEFLRETFHIVIGHYLRLMRQPMARALVRLTFLNNYYENASVINWYALSRHIRQNLRPFYDSLRLTAGSYVLPRDLPGLRASPAFSAASTPRQSAERRAAETIRNLDIITAIVGEPPSTPAEVTATYLPSNPRQVVQMFLDAHALIAILALWKPLDALEHMLTLAIYAGTSITGIDEDARRRWEREMTDLRGAFMNETRDRDHPTLEANIERWRARVQRLIDEIPPSVRRRQIAAAIAEQIPFLFVGGATTVRVGLWVSRITRGSRLLIALAEGATLTVLNFAATPPGAPGRPTTVGGWAGQFAVNTALAFFGRLIFQGAGLAADRLVQGRGLLIQLGARVAVPIAGITALQTAAQAVQARALQQGGETNYTEMFTLNLLLNSVGILLGAATLPPARGGTALAPRPSNAPAARPTPAELARQAGIPAEVARQLLEIGARLDEYHRSVATVQEAARRGALTEPQFEAMRRQALELIDFLGSRLPGIAAYLGGSNVSASSVAASLAAARARVNAASYSARPTVVALLPQTTRGLTQVGQTDTWVYPRERPPSNLPALRNDYQRRGHTVLALPGGGWEALPTATGMGARILPVSSSALATIAPSIETLASGPKAQAGLAQIRAQGKVTPALLEADLAAAATDTPARSAATAVLQQLRLLNPASVDSWQGLENYLRLGGDLPTLRRMLVLPDRAQMAAEQRLQVDRVLAAMRTWNGETLRGLKALYRLRPRTTTAELGRLLMEHPSNLSQGVLESIAVLEPDSRGLARVIGAFLTETTAGGSALTPQQIGAIGSLRTGVELRAQFPGRILSFEEKQFGPTGAVERIVDINVYERQSRRVAGREQVTEYLLTSVEVKEVTRQSLGRRAPHQLAVDIVRDHRIRAGRVTPVGTARPYFETLRWRIRRAEFQQEAMQRLRTTLPQDPRVEPEMRRMVQQLLEPAFGDPVLNQLPGGEADSYRRAFEGVPFVEFF